MESTSMAAAARAQSISPIRTVISWNITVTNLNGRFSSELFGVRHRGLRLSGLPHPLSDGSVNPVLVSPRTFFARS
jgi:hypothetical protein